MPNDKITAVGANIAEKAAMIWNVADMLRGPFKPHEYGLVILPMTVVKRFHDCLLPTHQAVLDTYEKVKKLQVIDGFLQKASGYQFYNTSRFTFETLLADPDNIESNFRDYLSGFSANAQDVLAKFDFDNIIKRMVESNTLYLVIKEFGSEKGYLGPDKISAVDCGYIFEDLVRRFSESFGEEAGAHFTSRDIIYLMTDLLLSEADLDTSSMTVYDMAMGTSQMLSCMEERIHELNSDIEVTCFGQEFNPSTFAIAKADMMIRGGDPNNMRFGDTLSEDQFPGYLPVHHLQPALRHRLEAGAEGSGSRGRPGRDGAFCARSAQDQRWSAAFCAERPCQAGKQGQDGHYPERLSPVQRRCRQRPQQHPAVYSGKRLAGLHHPAFHRYVHEHRHLHLHLGAQQG